SRRALGVAREVPPVSGDAGLLQQACTNLVTNAIHAMPNGGAVTLGACRGTDGGVERRGRRGARARRGGPDSRGGSRADLPALLHAQAPGLGHRPLDGLPDRPDARRADRRRLGGRPGHRDDDDASRGVLAVVAIMPRGLLTATLIALCGCSSADTEVL